MKIQIPLLVFLIVILDVILGISYFNLSRHKEAIEIFNQVIERDRGFLETYIIIGLNYFNILERKFYENTLIDESKQMLQKLI